MLLCSSLHGQEMLLLEATVMTTPIRSTTDSPGTHSGIDPVLSGDPPGHVPPTLLFSFSWSAFLHPLPVQSYGQHSAPVLEY